MDSNRKQDKIKDLFQKAEGVIIYSVTEVGLGISVKAGRGIFLVKKHSGKWSNPVAFDLSEWGLGASVGIDVKDCITFISDPNALKSLVRDYFGHTHVGPDISGTLAGVSGQAGEQLDKPEGVSTVTFSKGAFLGVKANWGSYRCPETENQRFYGRGKDVTPQNIILGKVDFPSDPKTEIDQVYEKLAQLAPYEASG